LGLPADSQKALRIAIKPTIRSNYNVINTTQKNKVWVTKNNFKKFLDGGINQAQIRNLEKTKKIIFIKKNGDLLKRYQYL